MGMLDTAGGATNRTLSESRVGRRIKMRRRTGNRERARRGVRRRLSPRLPGSGRPLSQVSTSVSEHSGRPLSAARCLAGMRSTLPLHARMTAVRHAAAARVGAMGVSDRPTAVVRHCDPLQSLTGTCRSTPAIARAPRVPRARRSPAPGAKRCLRDVQTLLLTVGLIASSARSSASGYSTDRGASRSLRDRAARSSGTSP